MSVRASRWWLFGIFVLTLPLPLLGPFAAYVPPVRLLILSFATASVAVVEGAAGTRACHLPTLRDPCFGISRVPVGSCVVSGARSRVDFWEFTYSHCCWSVDWNAFCGDYF